MVIVPRQPAIGARLVRVHRCPRFRVVPHEALQGRGIGGSDDFARTSFVPLFFNPITTDLPTVPRPFRVLRFAFDMFFSLPTHIGLVRLDRPAERGAVPVVGFPEPVRQVPSRLLRHFEIAM